MTVSDGLLAALRITHHIIKRGRGGDAHGRNMGCLKCLSRTEHYTLQNVFDPCGRTDLNKLCMNVDWQCRGHLRICGCMCPFCRRGEGAQDVNLDVHSKLFTSQCCIWEVGKGHNLLDMK